jgi:TolB-like protein/Flp pilus assembly protein TadD
VCVAIFAGLFISSMRTTPPSASPSPREARSAAAPEIRTVAVLPFKPVMSEMSDPALELGMADTLIARLGGGGDLVVRPLSSVRKYTSLEQDPIAAGHELGVDAVLDGSIQRDGDVLRVTTRLMRVQDGSSIWVDKLDQQWSNIFIIQDAIAEHVAGALALRLTNPQRQRLTRRYTENHEAYRLYLLGRYHFLKLIPQEIDTAIEYFHRSIEKDATYALAYGGLAEAYRALAITSDRRPSDMLPRGKADAMKALELDERLDSAWASLCFIQTWSDWDWGTAERSCKRALEINPNGADGHRAYAILLSDLGRHEQAVTEARRASELDPLALITNAIEGHVLHYAGKDDEAAEKLRATLQLDANFWVAHLFMGKVYLGRGQLGEALKEFEKARMLSGGNSETVSMIGYTFTRLGDRQHAQAALEELQARAAARYVPPFNIAMIYNGLGERDKTFEWLEKAYADRDVRLTFLKVERKWDALRSEPRFVSLAGRMALN